MSDCLSIVLQLILLIHVGKRWMSFVWGGLLITPVCAQAVGIRFISKCVANGRLFKAVHQLNWLTTGWTKKVNPIFCTLVTLGTINMRENGSFTSDHEQEYIIKLFYCYNVKYCMEHYQKPGWVIFVLQCVK